VARDTSSLQPTLTFDDDGAALTAGAGCKQVNDHSATCTGYNVIAVVTAGDGDDSVSGPVADVDGGPGNDTMSYAGRKEGMTVSLQQPLAGEDQLSAIESLRGGFGNDQLTGDAGPNTLDGGPGRDFLAGGEGPDVLAGGAGADALDGGAGNDQLDAGEDEARNSVGCGPGRDSAEPRPNTLIGPDCEFIGLDDFDLGGLVRLQLPLSSPRAPLVTMEPLDCIDPPCTVRMTVSAKRSVIGQVRLTSERKRRTAIELRLSPAGARMLKRSGPLDAKVRITSVESGERSSASFRIALSLLTRS
jgi:Ca2+-binding RTX toxin-like protein